MEQFLEATTVHGFYYLQRGNSILARLFWTAIIVVGFSFSGYMIYNSMLDWEENQTITTLDSIATPIQEAHFPTVTVCPHEKNAPDNWSFLEKFLNALDFSTENSQFEKFRLEVVNEIVSNLLDKVERKFKETKNSSVWQQNDESHCNVEYQNVIVHTANFLCQNKLRPKRVIHDIC